MKGTASCSKNLEVSSLRSGVSTVRPQALSRSPKQFSIPGAYRQERQPSSVAVFLVCPLHSLQLLRHVAVDADSESDAGFTSCEPRNNDSSWR